MMKVCSTNFCWIFFFFSETAEILRSGPMLLVGTSLGLAVINIKSREVFSALSFSGILSDISPNKVSILPTFYDQLFWKKKSNERHFCTCNLSLTFLTQEKVVRKILVKLTTERFRLRHVTTHRRTLRQRQTVRLACRTNCVGNYYDKKTVCIYSNIAHTNQGCHLAFLKIPNQPNLNYFVSLEIGPYLSFFETPQGKI
jgi:hypothetical protein